MSSSLPFAPSPFCHGRATPIDLRRSSLCLTLPLPPRKAPDAAPYVADGVIFTSYGSHTQRSSRTTYSIRREAGMRVDAMMGEADGEGEKDIVSLRRDGWSMLSEPDPFVNCV